MIRTQVSFDAAEYAEARQEAKARGISLAELVRQAVRKNVGPRGEAPWMRFAGLVASGDRRSSRRIDEIVYGPKD